MLTQKETNFLNEFKAQEKLCVEKYTRYAESAHAAPLKNLFSTLAQAERTHLETINQVLGGTTPQPAAAPSATQSVCNDKAEYDDTQQKKDDSLLCQDMLATEKQVSALYNTGVFEFSDPLLRDTLAHIQKEEQNHGEQIYSYMAANGMYA
jgi:spore coat protein CotF